jgi:formiminotetrahydrofolate cyclodeaminase
MNRPGNAEWPAFERFLDALASRAPTPGGGAAAAAGGAMACALARKAVAYSGGSTVESAVQDRVRALAERLRRADELLRSLALEDAAAYERLTEARRAIGQTPEARSARQEAIRVAAAVPLEAAAAVSVALSTMDEEKAIINPRLTSDWVAAAVLAEAAARAAALFVRTNLSFLDDPAERDRFRTQIDEIIEHCGRASASIQSHAPSFV